MKLIKSVNSLTEGKKKKKWGGDCNKLNHQDQSSGTRYSIVLVDRCIRRTCYCHLHASVLNTEVHLSKMPVPIYHTPWLHIPEDHNLNPLTPNDF